MKKRKKINHKVGDIHTIEGITYDVRFINAGMAFLAPMDDIQELNMYYCCIQLKLDEYAFILK